MTDDLCNCEQALNLMTYLADLLPRIDNMQKKWSKDCDCTCEHCLEMESFLCSVIEELDKATKPQSRKPLRPEESAVRSSARGSAGVHSTMTRNPVAPGPADSRPPLSPQHDTHRFDGGPGEVPARTSGVGGGAPTDTQHLGNLLARIHRDGGHYQNQYGTEIAVQDADGIVCRLLYFAESVAEGPCWCSRAVDESRDCPRRMANGRSRYYDWCSRCQAKYWALGQKLHEVNDDSE